MRAPASEGWRYRWWEIEPPRTALQQRGANLKQVAKVNQPAAGGHAKGKQHQVENRPAGNAGIEGSGGSQRMRSNVLRKPPESRRRYVKRSKRARTACVFRTQRSCRRAPRASYT